ncbi:MAG: FAD-dependent oxidoreductase [Acidobacteriota bacterium]
MARYLTRRRFLQLSGLAAPAAPAALQRLTQPGPADAGDPVVIVGAGLAGLRAADLLRQAGRRVVVLEARDRPGGRVLTIRSPFDDSLHAEAGPIRIAGVHQAVLRTVRSLGLTLTPFASSQGSAVVAIKGSAATAAGGGALIRDLKPDDHGLDQAALLERYIGDLPADLAEPAATADSYARWQPYDRVTWPDYLRSRGASPEAITLMTVGGDAAGLSALYVLRQFAMLRRSTQRYKIQGGMDQLPAAMAAALGTLVRYNAPVVGVTRQSSARPGGGRATAPRFRVDYRSSATSGRGNGVESLAASRVIFAIPCSTLRDIEIRPRLSAAKARAIAQLSYYSVARFLLQSRQRFWRSADLSGSARTDRATEVWDSTFDQVASRRGILGASVGGGIGRTLRDMTTQGSLAFGIDLVADAFPAIRTQFEKGVVQRWDLEPWSRGAFPVFKPGEMSTLMPTIARAEGGLHFAGEHTSSWTGWMEGALQSGERAAGEVLSS